MRMVLAPAAIMFSIAVTWPALSPSLLPAALSSLAPSFLGLGIGTFLHLDEEGLVSVLVIRPITGSAPGPQGSGDGSGNQAQTDRGVVERCDMRVSSCERWMTEQTGNRTRSGRPAFSPPAVQASVANRQRLNQHDLISAFLINLRRACDDRHRGPGGHRGPQPWETHDSTNRDPGEALMDCIAQADGTLLPVMGAARSTSARRRRLQGAAGRLLAPFSTDAFGQQLKALRLADGVRRSARQPAADLARGRDAGAGQPSYGFYREGIADRDYGPRRRSCDRCSPAPGVLHTGR